MIYVEFIQSLIEINSKWQNGYFDSKTRIFFMLFRIKNTVNVSRSICLAQSTPRHNLWMFVIRKWLIWKLAHSQFKQSVLRWNFFRSLRWVWSKTKEGYSGVAVQWCLFQLKNNRSHSAHISTGFARLWIEIAQFRDTLPFGARFNLCCFCDKLLLRISASNKYAKWKEK